MASIRRSYMIAITGKNLSLLVTHCAPLAPRLRLPDTIS